MNAPQHHRRSFVGRFLRSWYLPAAFLVILLLVIGWWLVPRRTADVVSIDGQHRWSKSEAPPQHNIIWQPAEPLDVTLDDKTTQDNLIRPQLADGGATLYFTVRSDDGGADIYRSRLVDGKWQTAESVENLNTPSDDIGPVISNDGGQLYLYSNRPGGEGGFDLYVSRRVANEWTKPQNLGRGINTPAHEFDPAISPDAQRLFFASNRTPQMQQRVAEQRDDPEEREWSATLRAQQGLAQFDLYQARRDNSQDNWQLPRPLAGANRGDSNEGAPFISPSGVFLYFASDRPNESGDRRNFDLYRARMTGHDVELVQNLGAGVNSAANETEPALSPEGFRILFSSDRAADAQASNVKDLYALYSSTAVETYDEVAWDTSNLSALLAFLAANWWWLVLLALLLALLAALIWCIRELSLGRATVPVFLLLALIIHLIVGTGSFFVYFGDELATKARQAFEEVLVATNIHQSHEAGQEAYEKVADLKSVETIKPADVPRQMTETPNVPVPTDSPLPSVPTKVHPVEAPQPVVETPPKLEGPSTDAPQLERRRPSQLDAEMRIEPVEIAQTQPVEETAESEPEQLRVQFDRSTPSQQQTPAPTTLQRRPVEVEMVLEREFVPTERPDNAPRTPQETSPIIERVARAEPRPTDPPRIAAEPIAPAVETSSEQSTATASVAVARQPLAPENMSLPESPRVATNMSNVKLPPETVTAERPPVAPEIAQRAPPIPVERMASNITRPNDAPQVTTELMTAPSDTPAPQDQIAAVSVDAARRQMNDASQSLPSTSFVTTESNPNATRLVATESLQRVTQTDEFAPQKSLAETPLQLARNSASVPEFEAESMKIETAALTQPLDNSAAGNVPAAVSLAIAKDGQSDLAQRFEAMRVASLPNDVAAPTAAASERVLGQAPALLKTTDDFTPVARAARSQSAVAPAESDSIPAESLGAVAASVEEQPETIALASVRQTDLSPTDNVMSTRVIEDETSESDVASPKSLLNSERSLANAALSLPQTNDSLAALIRTRPANRAVAEEAIATVDAAATANTPSGQRTVNGIDIGLNRPAAELLLTNLDTATQFGGQFNRRDPRLIVGSLAEEEIDTPPSFDPIATRIVRQSARAPLLLYAEDNIGLQAMLRLRGADMEVKKDLVQAFGGDDRVLQAVERGLTWIEVHQHDDGHWSLNQFNEMCKGHKCNGHGSTASDTAATGLALLPFLGDGHTHVTGKYQSSVKRGLHWLVAHQKEDGDLFTGPAGNNYMYSHGIATIALCEAYGMSKDPALREPAQRAINFIAHAQHNEGGWRYQPKQEGDTSVMGWQIMALKSGQMAGLDVPQTTLDKAKSWLHNKAGGKGQNIGTFGYTGPGGSAAMTAEALLCLEYMGTERNDPHLRGGAEFLARSLPHPGRETSYYWYYGTQVMYHMQGDYWQKWNDALRDILVDSQVNDGPMAGTWDPKDNWESSGGRIYSTSLRLLMLEVYYRHLPLYQVLDQ